jgi:hypothetical protein
MRLLHAMSGVFCAAEYGPVLFWLRDVLITSDDAIGRRGAAGAAEPRGTVKKPFKSPAKPGSIQTCLV